MEVVGGLSVIAMIVAFPIWFVDMIGYVKALNWDALVKNGGGFLGAFIIVWLVAQTRFAGAVPVGTGDLEDANLAEVVLIAFGFLAIGSGLVIRAVKAIDGTQTAKTPVLVASNKPYTPTASDEKLMEARAAVGKSHDTYLPPPA